MSILYLIQAFPYWCKCWWSSFFPLSTHFCYYKQCCNNYPCTHISNTSLRANICPLLFMSEELGEFSQISGLGFSGVRKICFPYRRLIVDSILAERYLIRLTRLRFIVREHWAKFSGIHFFFFRLCCGYLVLAQLNSVYYFLLQLLCFLVIMFFSLCLELLLKSQFSHVFVPELGPLQ